MNLITRFTSFWLLFFHFSDKLAKGEAHQEVCETSGPIILGKHIGFKFHRRFCATCGFNYGEK